MRIAIFLDFNEYTDHMCREGVIVFLKNAMKAWIEYDRSITFELWCFPEDRRKVYKDFNDLFYGCKDRFDIYPQKVIRKDLSFRTAGLRLGAVALAQAVVHAFIPFTKYGKRMGERTKINRETFLKYRLILSRCFNRESKADIVYIPFIDLEGALGVNKPVVMQIHDLYIFLLRDLFEKELTYKVDIDKWERETIGRLKEYSKQGAFFQTSSEFTKKEQILKYVKYISEEQCKVIKFPPMIKSYDEKEILSEKEFREKYHIGDYKYIAFPSQNRPGKNIITLLKAITIVNQQGWDIRLVTTGTMNDIKSTAAYVKNHKQIVIEIGHIPEVDLPALYKYSTMVVCPNIIEGQLISDQAVSALKIGNIPVIHGLSLGIEEAIDNIGMNMETADLKWFELYDENDLATKMIDVLKDPTTTIEKQKKVAEAFREKTWEDFAESSISFYESIISKNL